jgi:hypothetical protein
MNPSVPDVNATQEFIVGALILLRKWQDHVDQYDSFRQQVVQIVPELDPPFEGGQRKR